MKKIIFSLLAVLLCAALSLSAAAAELPYCADTAGLLTETEQTALEEQLSALSSELQFDIAVVTMDTLSGWSAPDAAAAVFDQYGFGAGEQRSGALLLLGMEEREWGIATSGAGEYLLTDWDCDSIGELILPALSSGDYASAFATFGDAVASYVRSAYTEGETGGDYAYDDYGGYEEDYGGYGYSDGMTVLPRAEFPLSGYFFLSLTVSLLVALISTSVMKGKLKSVRQQQAAANYIDTASLVLTDTREIFLRSDVTRTMRESSSSSGRSSVSSGHSSGASGRSGGKF